jgi:hypothetical protein
LRSSVKQSVPGNAATIAVDVTVVCQCVQTWARPSAVRIQRSLELVGRVREGKGSKDESEVAK